MLDSIPHGAQESEYLDSILRVWWVWLLNTATRFAPRDFRDALWARTSRRETIVVVGLEIRLRYGQDILAVQSLLKEGNMEVVI